MKCKAIAFKIHANVKLTNSDKEFYRKNKTGIELMRLQLNKNENK